MKLFFLNSGQIEMKKKIFIPQITNDERFLLPVISTFIQYKNLNILFDTGCHPSVETKAEERWGGLSKIMKPKNMNGINLISELNKKNIGPNDIDIVINSHLHPDHCGCNEFFTNAEFYCHKNEFEVANSSDAKKFGYIKNEWDLPMGLKKINEDFDFFNNSKIVTINLFGHTPGTIGLLVNLDKNQFLIASDAVSLLRNLEYEEIPKNVWNANELMKSYKKIKEISQKKIKLICGHDYLQWKNNFKLGIEYN